VVCSEEHTTSSEFGLDLIDPASTQPYLEDDLIDRARQRYYSHQHESSRDSHKALLLSLVEVSERVTDILKPALGWQFGETRQGDFGFIKDGEAKAFINRAGEVWGSKAEGYFQAGSQSEPGNSAKLDEDANKATAGKWHVGVTASGSLGFFKGDVLELFVQEGRMWGKAEGGFFTATPRTTSEQLAIEENGGAKRPGEVKDLKRNSVLKLGDWSMGEDRATGALVIFLKDALQVFLDADGGVFTTADQGYLEPKGHAVRHPGAIMNAIHTQEQDCTVETWGTWTPCSRPCGGGTQNRMRHVETPERNGGADCPELTESRPCLQSFHGDLDSCPTDCVVSEWVGWSDCTAVCAGGSSQRHRNITSYPSSRGVACPALHESMQCNTDLCGAELCTTVGATLQPDPLKPHQVVITSGDKWVFYDTDESKILLGPSTLKEDGSWFKGLPLPFSAQIDATVSSGDASGETVVFSHGVDEEGIERSQWLLFDTKENEVARGPYEMSATGHFDTLLAPFNTTIETALQSSGNEAYFFSGGQWLLFDVANRSIVEGPYEINSAPSLNLPAPFNQKIDASIGYPDSTAILFSGYEWLRWDTTSRQVTQGPYGIADHPKFEPLLQALNVCGGYDLRTLGAFYTKLTTLRPVPTGKTSRMFDSFLAGFKNGRAAEAQFNSPSGIAPLGDDTLYVVDSGNNAVRRVDRTSLKTTTVAGGSIQGGLKDGSGPDARFNSPSGITGVRIEGTNLDGDLLYVADTKNHAIRRLWIEKGSEQAVVQTVAGGGAATSRCDQCDRSGSVAASSELTKCRSCCDCQTEVMGFRDDEYGEYAMFAEPSGVAIAYEPNGDSLKGKNEVVYVADSRNNAIRQLILSPGMEFAQVSTIAGGQRMLPSMKDYMQVAKEYQWGHGFGLKGCADGVGSDAMFNAPTDLALAKVQADKHVLYVADSSNNRVARVEVSMMMNDGTPTEEIPILSIRDSEGNAVGAIRSVPVGSEYQWDSEQKVWEGIIHSDLTAVSICPATPVVPPAFFELSLGGQYNVIGAFMEWGPEGGAQEFQMAVFDGKQWHEVIAKTGVANAATEQLELPVPAQQLVAQAVRLSITSAHGATVSVPSLRLMGKLVGHDVKPQPAQEHPQTEKSCADLGWEESPAGADSAIQENACGSQKVGKNSTCLHLKGNSTSGMMQWHEAEDACSAIGARLCRIEEIQGLIAADTGCDLEEERVWSASPCGCGGMLSQASKIELDIINSSSALRMCSSMDDLLAVQCCADGPPAGGATKTAAANATDVSPVENSLILVELNEDPVSDDSASAATDIIEASSSTVLLQMRFTNGTGTADKDSSCVIPFVLDGRAYNNCTQEPTVGGTETFQDGWCPTRKSGSDNADESMIVVGPKTPWGVCEPAGYVPPKCVMSPWSGWNRCSVLCGGGSRTRHRQTVTQQGDAQCGALDEVGSCNAHQCGSVKTIVGGTSAVSGKMGVGFRNTPLNPKWMQRHPGKQPDLNFNPFRIDVLQQADTDVLYILAKPQGRADHVTIIRRIDVTSSTSVVDGGTGVPEGCFDMSNHTDSDPVPASIAECRVIQSQDGSQVTAEVIGSGVESEGAISLATTNNNQIYTSLTSNTIASIDLALHLPCQQWMSADLEGWQIGTQDSTLHKTTASMMLSTSHHGEPQMWNFEAFRRVGTLVSVGLDKRYDTDAHGRERQFQKSTLCSTQKKSGLEVQDSKQCCVTKEAMAVPEPRQCPSPITPECRLERQIDVLDSEYANGLISKALWI
jgi:hypothetical protein